MVRGSPLNHDNGFVLDGPVRQFAREWIETSTRQKASIDQRCCAHAYGILCHVFVFECEREDVGVMTGDCL